MGQQLIRQPNGLYCYWSSVTDSINGFDYRPEDYIEQQVEREAFRIAEEVYRSILRKQEGIRTSFTRDWKDASNPPKCDCGQCHHCAEVSPCDCDDPAPCDEAPNDSTPTGETAEWIANINKGLRAGGKPMPQFKDLALRPAPSTDNAVIGVYRHNVLVGFVTKYSFSEGWVWETGTERFRGSVQEGVSLLTALRAVLRLDNSQGDTD